MFWDGLHSFCKDYIMKGHLPLSGLGVRLYTGEVYTERLYPIQEKVYIERLYPTGKFIIDRVYIFQPNGRPVPSG